MGFLQTLYIIFQILTLAAGIKGYREARKLQKKGQDILATKNADGGKIPVIYGARRVGSTLIYMDTDSGNSKELFVVYGLSVGEVESIDLETIEIDGVSIKDSKVFRQGYYAGYDSIASGAGSLNTASQIGDVQESNGGQSGTDPTKRYRMVFNAHLGADNQTADPMLVASISKWTSAHRLRGIAYIAASFEYDSRGMFTSVPELTVVVKGKKLYDPRLDGSISGGSGSHRINDPSTFEWSDNAALALLDYISNDEYGKGLSSSLINLQSFQTAANTAETLVDVPEFGGSYASATFSGTTGNNYIDIDSDSWETIKGGAYISLKDSVDDNEFTDVRATESQRFTPHTENTVYRTFVTQSLQNSYTNEAGSLLVKVKRFHCNGMVDTNDNVLENTRDLLSNIRGFLNFVDGKYTVLIEDTASSAFSVTDDHIIDDQGIKISYEDKSSKYNKVVVSFFNAQKKYEADTVTVYHTASPNYKSDDGGEELEAKVEFDYITNPYIAYNIGKAILGRSRNQKTISFLATPELYQLTVGDVIDITYAGLGLSGHLFRIEAIDLLENGLLNIQAIEYLDIYTWDSVAPIENVGALPDLPTGLEARPPTNLTFTDSNSSATGRPFLSWTAATNYPAKEFRVVIVDSSSNELHNRIVSNASIDLNFIPVGSNYVASVSSINSLGSESDAATLTFSVSVAPVAQADLKDAIVSTAKLVDDAVTNAKIAVDAIQGDVIAAGAITTTKIGANAVTTAKLANDAVTSDIIAAGAITATEISDGAISTPKLAAGAVTTVKLAAGSVTSNEIFANTITAGNIASGAINTDELAANAVTAAKIAANTITASEIASGTITATQIATGTLTSASGVFGVISANDITTGTLNASNVSVINLNADNISTGTLNADLLQIDGVTLDTDINGNLIISSGGVGSTQLATNAVTSTKITDAAVTTAKLVDAAITTVKIAADAVTNAKIATDAIQGDVIAAGAITTTKLGANAVTTAKIANDAVTSDIIAAGAVTTTEISDNAISTAKLIAGSITTAKIAAGAVTANEIAANTITAGQIAAGAINTDELAANAVTAAKIAANTITASEIAAGTITATQIAADTITAANIAAGAIATSELAANAVTAAKIAANTITAGQIATGTITSNEIAAGTIVAADIASNTITASQIAAGTLTSASGVFGIISANDVTTGTLNATNVSVINLNADNISTGTLNANRIQIDNVTLDTDGSGNLIIKTNGVDTGQIATDAVTTAKIIDRATSVFATATQGIGYWYVDNLAQTAIVTTGVFQAPSATGNTFFVIGNTYINANSGSSTADWCELQIQRRSASTSGGVSSASYITIATIRARGETGEALQSIIANDSYTADYYYQYRVTLQTNGTGVLYSTRSYGISGIQVIVNYK